MWSYKNITSARSKKNQNNYVMRQPFFKLSLVLLICWGCQSTPRSQDGRQPAEEKEHTGGAYRFLRVYHSPVEDTVYLDSTLLQFQVADQQVSGSYLWVLPGKDGKSGTIRGRMSGDTVYGRYHYQQEGGKYDDSIQVVLQDDQAIVTQFSSDGYQLKDTLPQN